MATTAVLYTPEVLALATGLADFRLTDDLTLRADVRSRSCGSTLTMGLLFSERDLVNKVGVSSQACAIGQASAAIFAQGAGGRSGAEIRDTTDAIKRWLSGEGEMPDWPGLGKIAAARDYAGRHGALMLPWTAAVQILSSRAGER